MAPALAMPCGSRLWLPTCGAGPSGGGGGQRAMRVLPSGFRARPAPRDHVSRAAR